mmetsp:Transcript_32694/g.77548  ORF Transcript_32694/g.77548 Transcript_32694/m.77548 type:complete len:228 (+) Transcript_32694:608-1291(+)
MFVMVLHSRGRVPVSLLPGITSLRMPLSVLHSGGSGPPTSLKRRFISSRRPSALHCRGSVPCSATPGPGISQPLHVSVRVAADARPSAEFAVGAPIAEAGGAQVLELEPHQGKQLFLPGGRGLRRRRRRRQRRPRRRLGGTNARHRWARLGDVEAEVVLVQVQVSEKRRQLDVLAAPGAASGQNPNREVLLGRLPLQYEGAAGVAAADFRPSETCRADGVLGLQHVS